MYMIYMHVFSYICYMCMIRACVCVQMCAYVAVTVCNCMQLYVMEWYVTVCMRVSVSVSVSVVPTFWSIFHKRI